MYQRIYASLGLNELMGQNLISVGSKMSALYLLLVHIACNWIHAKRMKRRKTLIFFKTIQLTKSSNFILVEVIVVGAGWSPLPHSSLSCCSRALMVWLTWFGIMWSSEGSPRIPWLTLCGLGTSNNDWWYIILCPIKYIHVAWWYHMVT